MDILTFTDTVIVTRDFAKKLCLAIETIGRTMKPDDLMQISIFNKTVLIETDDIQTVLKLENQE